MENVVEFVSAVPIPNEPRYFSLDNDQITGIAIVLVIAIFALVFVALAGEPGATRRVSNKLDEPGEKHPTRREM